MGKIVISENKTDLIQRFKDKFPYSYTGKIKELMEEALEKENEKEKEQELTLKLPKGF